MGGVGKEGEIEMLLIIVCFILLVLPTIIAVSRNIDHKCWVVLLNVAGVFTVVGWVIALVWAILAKRNFYK